jgi:hypothetical protein
MFLLKYLNSLAEVFCLQLKWIAFKKEMVTAYLERMSA